MRALLLTLLLPALAAAPPSPRRARDLAAAGQWDELYLTFASADPKRHEPRGRREIGAALTQGCAALLEADPVLALSLAERAVAFAETKAGLRCRARSWLAVEKLRREEGAAAAQGSLTYESGVGPGGMRVRSNSRFQIRYFNNERDFGQRADYEGKVTAALERAHEATRRILGVAREAPVDVILYTREEFALHHGRGTALSVLGFYGHGAIRLNDSEELTAENTATLVHEYVHAVVDELGGRGEGVPIWLDEGLATFVEWRFQGRDGPHKLVTTRVRAGALRGELPTLDELTDTPLVSTRDPMVAYAVCGFAVRQLVKEGGAERLVSLLRELGRGQPFEQAFARSYSKPLSAFEEALLRELTRS